MSIIGIVALAVILLCTATGAVVGALKGYTKVKSWAAEYLAAGILTIVFGAIIRKNLPGGGSGFSAVAPALITFAIAIVFILLFAVLSWRGRIFFEKGLERRKQLSYYRQYDQIEDNREQILDALDVNDKKAYKKLTKHKFKYKGGVWTVLNRVFGGITSAIKCAVVSALIFSCVLAFVEFSHLAETGGALNGFLGDVYGSGVWKFVRKYLMDMIVLGLLSLCIKTGFSSGISNAVWVLVVLGLIAFAGYASYYMVAKTTLFDSAAQALGGRLSGLLEKGADILEKIKLTDTKIAKIILGAGVFILMLIPIILAAVFVPQLIGRARESKIFGYADGVMGAIIVTALVFGILFVVGAVVDSLQSFGFMDVFNNYFVHSKLAVYMYGDNLLVSMGLGDVFSIGKYLR